MRAAQAPTQSWHLTQGARSFHDLQQGGDQDGSVQPLLGFQAFTRMGVALAGSPPGLVHQQLHAVYGQPPPLEPAMQHQQVSGAANMKAGKVARSVRG